MGCSTSHGQGNAFHCSTWRLKWLYVAWHRQFSVRTIQLCNVSCVCQRVCWTKCGAFCCLLCLCLALFGDIICDTYCLMCPLQCGVCCAVLSRAMLCCLVQSYAVLSAIIFEGLCNMCCLPYSVLHRVTYALLSEVLMVDDLYR